MDSLVSGLMVDVRLEALLLDVTLSFLSGAVCSWSASDEVLTESLGGAFLNIEI